ncbi:sulfurtransferase complex subunit TusB [Kushneria aurantia]|uniref:Sulfurtransferase complex subunit TusB n=1 Tax=Kushneria aurantia TaxID=504092 RepID=A0ABV6G400_9GAMM|nr:sulfurtransferase complex subunit TusB [Kushneria aurantia]
MSTLHLVNHSAFTSRVLEEVRHAAQEGDAIMLIEDGVYSALGADIMPFAPRVSVYLLTEDARARGLDADGITSASVRPVDVAGFVNLTAEHDRTLSWS